MAETTKTENNAVGYATTGMKCLDFFSLPTRGYDSYDLTNLFNEAFNEDPYIALQILYHLRDPRNGKGEKELTLELLMFMMGAYPANFAGNINSIVSEYGCYKMLCEIYARDYKKNKSSASIQPLNILVKALQEGIPLAAKWAPSEHSHYNHKEYGYQALKICNLLGMIRKTAKGISRPDYQAYRKLLTPLRTKANIVEQFCCSDRWTDIDFNKVAARAMMNLSKRAFNMHCKDEFVAWQAAVRQGKAEIKTKGLQCHEIIKHVLDHQTITETQELQWKSMVDVVKKSGHLKNALAMSDVSGSMYNNRNPQAIEVSIALGIFISEVASGMFHRKILTFSLEPSIIEVKGETLTQKIQCIATDCMGYNTNYVKALRSILAYGQLFKIKQEDMPTMIFVLTDMEFDEATSGNKENKTPHQVVKDDYEEAGYQLPKIIFWNLANRSGALPVQQRDEHTALVSGFSQTLLKAFMELKPEDAFDPISIMKKILSDYNPIVCEEDTSPFTMGTGVTWDADD